MTQEITLTALRSPEDEYAASVRSQVYTHDTGTRKESDRGTAGDTEPAPLAVSLPVTPSIGCSQPVHHVVKQGRVYAG
ncbi:hypothetical protein [Streptomyces sp. NPDC002172]